MLTTSSFRATFPCEKKKKIDWRETRGETADLFDTERAMQPNHRRAAQMPHAPFTVLLHSSFFFPPLFFLVLSSKNNSLRRLAADTFTSNPTNAPTVPDSSTFTTFSIMTRRVGTLRVTAPPPSPSSPPHPQLCSQSPTPCPTPCLTPHTPTTNSSDPSPKPTPSNALPPPDVHTTSNRQPPLSKNLRWTAVALVSKLSSELERPSAAVADEVAHAASIDMRQRYPHRDTAPVERNTRRRVYDALKVMVAVGCIQRNAKDLRWIGVNHLRHPAYSAPSESQEKDNQDTSEARQSHAISVAAMRVAIHDSRRRIARKKAIAQELQHRIRAFEALHQKRMHQQEPNLPTNRKRLFEESQRFPFPLTLVKGNRPEVTHSSDRSRMRIFTSTPFSLYSETDIVTMLAEDYEMPVKKPRLSHMPRSPRPSQNEAAKQECHIVDIKSHTVAVHRISIPKSTTTTQGESGEYPGPPTGNDHLGDEMQPTSMGHKSRDEPLVVPNPAVKVEQHIAEGRDMHDEVCGFAQHSPHRRPRSPRVFEYDDDLLDDPQHRFSPVTPPVPLEFTRKSSSRDSRQAFANNSEDLICEEELSIPPLPSGDTPSGGSGNELPLSWKGDEDDPGLEHVVLEQVLTDSSSFLSPQMDR